MKKKGTNTRGKTPILLRIVEIIGGAGIILATWFLLTLIMDKLVMPFVTFHWSEREIPDLYEYTVAEAEAAVAQKGFRLEVTGSRYDGSHAAGVIIEQKPDPYNLSKVGRRIQVVVSGGEQLIAMPKVEGETLRDAVFKLESAGFVIDMNNIKRVFSSYYPSGVVVSQSVKPGSLITADYPVEISVSLGELPDRFIVPDLRGLELKDALDELISAGLEVGVIREQLYPEFEPGLVVAQEPTPDTELDYLGKVNLTICVREQNKDTEPNE